MAIPATLKYSKEHEWVKVEGDIAVVGITDHAQEALGEIVYLELPAKGEKVEKDKAFGVVESTKAVSDIFAPISGDVTEVHGELINTPEILNKDPYDKGWLVKIRIGNKADLDALLDAKAYEAFLKESA